MTKPTQNPTTRLAPQALILLLALTLWSWWPTPAFWTLAAGYLLAWLILQTLRRQVWTVPLGKPAIWLVAIVLAAGPLTALIRMRGSVAAAEGLRGLGTWLSHRDRLENLPSIAPPVLFADHPQTLYVHAPNATTIHLDVGLGVQLLDGEDLGHGLFRVDYNPRVHGVPETDFDTIETTLRVDGKQIPRRLMFVRFATHPRWFASAPRHGLAATVSEETDEVMMVSRDGLAWRVQVGDGPTDVAFLDQDRVLAVAHRYDPALWLLDALSGETLRTIDAVPNQVRLAVSADGSRLAVAVDGFAPSIQIFATAGLGGDNPATPSVIELAHQPDWLVFGPQSDVLMFSSRASRSLHKLTSDEQAQWHSAAPLELGRPVVSLAATANHTKLWLATTDYRPGGEPHRGNHFIQDQLLLVDVQSWRVVDQRLTAKRTPSQTRAGNTDQGVSPMGLVERANGSVLVAFAGSDEVWSLATGEMRPQWTITSNDLELIAPHGVGDLGDGHWVASSPAGGCMAVFDPNGLMAEFIAVTPADDVLAAAARGSLVRQTLDLRSGERAFYETTRAGISCQSCHLHASTDESPHDIGQRPLLPTLTVRGITGTAPYLRDGSFLRIRDLDTHLAGVLYRGYHRDVPARGQLLERFVERLPRKVNPARLRPRNLPRERAGLDAFVAAGCVTCHTLPAFTNLGQHPVRTLFPGYGTDQLPYAKVDTPSLLDSHARAHFLQDGRAHDLFAVLDDHNSANRHGDTARLDTNARADLVHFLLAL